MRFYKIRIIKKDGDLFVPLSMKPLGLKDASYTSVTAGYKPLMSALDVGIDITIAPLGSPVGSSTIRIRGISMDDIAQFNNLNDATVTVWAGMLDGYLPLSKHYRPDLLTRGRLWQTSGNWEGTETSLDLYIIPLLKPGLNPKLEEAGASVNIMFDWKVGTKLEPALQDILDKTYAKTSSNPNGYEVEINISDKLVARGPMPGGPYSNMSQFGRALKKYTRESFPDIETLDGAKYDGVDLLAQDKLLIFDDRTKKSKRLGKYPKDRPLEIKFHELIGQPVWKTQNMLVFKTIMRGDLVIRDYVKLPGFLQSPYVLTQTGQNQASNTATGPTPPSRDRTTFKGAFQIQAIRHSGQFRQAAGNSWVTTYEALIGTEKKPKVLSADDPLEAQTGEDSGKDPKSTVPLPAPNPENPINGEDRPTAPQWPPPD